jgi:hypothetical protein
MFLGGNGIVPHQLRGHVGVSARRCIAWRTRVVPQQGKSGTCIYFLQTLGFCPHVFLVTILKLYV